MRKHRMFSKSAVKAAFLGRIIRRAIVRYKLEKRQSMMSENRAVF